jgi:acyl carrier protein
MVPPIANQKLKTELMGLVEGHLVDFGRNLSAEEDLFNAGLESMGIMQLIIQIEERLGVVIGDADVTRDNFASVTALAALVVRLGYSCE